MSKDDPNSHRQWLHIPARNSQAQPEDRSDSKPAHEPGLIDEHRAQPEPAEEHKGQAAAQNVVRSQLDHIYETNPPHQAEAQPAPQESDVPPTYDRHGSETAGAYDWRAYHTAWQDYYQQYYQRYYLQQLQQQKQRQAHTKAAAATDQAKHPEKTEKQAKPDPDQFQKELLGKVSERARKVRGSSHFLPIVSAVVVGLLFFLFQFNKAIAAQVHAYVSPSTTISDNVIVDPSASVPVGDEARLVIPKINVDAPIVLGLDSLDNATTQVALKDGVVHYPISGASSLPGQAGNTVLLGHSSNYVFDDGDYKFVFVLLPRMEQGDLFYIHFEGKRYVYRVTEKEVITPQQVEKLATNSDKPTATLVTCVPIGTNDKRLLLRAEQISPDPSTAEQVAPQSGDNQDITLPGNRTTILERLFDF